MRTSKFLDFESKRIKNRVSNIEGNLHSVGNLSTREVLSQKKEDWKEDDDTETTRPRNLRHPEKHPASQQNPARPSLISQHPHQEQHDKAFLRT